MILFDSELTKQERERRLRIVKNGKNGEFWSILKSELEILVKVESGYLDSYKGRGISDKDLMVYNKSVARLNTLNELLNMPQIIITHNENFLKRIADKVKKGFEYVSFVNK